MRLAVLLLNKMHIIGSYKLDSKLFGKLNQVGVYLLLTRIGVVGGVRLVGLMTLKLKIEVIAKEVLEPTHSLACTLDVALEQLLRNLAADAGRAANQTLVVLLQKGVVDTRRIEIAFGESY